MRSVWTRRRFLCALGSTALGLASPVRLRGSEEKTKQPNVLFIALDDLNDWTQVLDAEAPIRTPNIDRLAKRGVLFTRAYCASAACNPSRTAILTGLRPTTSGVYGNKTDWRKALPDAVTLPQHFMAHGYRAEGAGKIFHHHYGGAFHDKASFDDFLMMPDPPDAPMPKKKLNGLVKYGSRNTDWGPWPTNEVDAIDVRTTNYVIRSLKKKHDKPFFLAAGIFRPHMPFIIVDPGITHPGTRCERPVSLIDIYPTLIDLCGLDQKPELDGLSLVPLLRNPNAKWARPAVMTYMRGNHAVRDQRWRYIRYADGTEELYDHQKDPGEWYNVAANPDNTRVINRLKQWLPTAEASPAPDMKKSRISTKEKK